MRILRLPSSNNIKYFYRQTAISWRLHFVYYKLWRESLHFHGVKQILLSTPTINISNRWQYDRHSSRCPLKYDLTFLPFTTVVFMKRFLFSYSNLLVTQVRYYPNPKYLLPYWSSVLNMREVVQASHTILQPHRRPYSHERQFPCIPVELRDRRLTYHGWFTVQSRNVVHSVLGILLDVEQHLWTNVAISCIWLLYAWICTVSKKSFLEHTLFHILILYMIYFLIILYSYII